MKQLSKLTLTVLVLFIQVRACAQFTWNFTSASSSGTIANITAGNIVSVNSNCGGFLANGLPASALPGASGGRNGNSCTKTGVLNTATSTYVEVVLTPSAISWVNVTAIEWGNYSFNATGPTTYSIYSNADNFSAAAATVTSAQNSTWTLLNPAISLTGITGTNLTIRIYASGGGSAATNWRIDDLKITATAQAGTAGQLAKFTSSTTVANSIVTELNNKIGIGTTTPVAKLDVAGNFKLTDGTQGAGKVLTSDANGLTSWQTSFGNNVWALAGNNATNPGPNFIGTTDNKGLMFKTNNIQSGYIDLINTNASFGQSTLKNNTSGTQNTAIGASALSANTSGYANTASGNGALFLNTTGFLNTATGVNSLSANTTGTLNSGSGAVTLYFNTTGDRNAAFGYGALLSNTTGSFNTANGNVAGSSITTGSNNSLLGSNTGIGIITGSNNTILGANVTGLAANLSNNIIIADGSGNRRINVDASGNMGIGTITPAAKLDVAGTIKVADGTQATGKVLTSDANGLASWQTPAITGIPNIIAVNGLTAVNANTIKLGGQLTEHTIINGSNLYNLTVDSANFIVRAPGGFGSGQIIPSYDGPQMYFYPRKSAFRAGGSNTAEWDDANVGIFSAALGLSTTANNFYSFATGVRTIASGLGSTAMGSYSVASGDYSFAIGASDTANGFSSVGMGFGTKASGIASLAMGQFSLANGDFSNSLGRYLITNSYAGTAIGQYNAPDFGLGVAFGGSNRAFQIGIGQNDNDRRNAMTVLFNGNTGIGTTIPDASLHIAGNFKLVDGTEGAGKVLTSDADGLASWAPIPPALMGGGCPTFTSSGKNLIYNTGSIGIGVDKVPEGYKLFVAGNMASDKMSVKIQSWPDYVFSPDYKLPGLLEVEKFIKVNNHLPGVHSAADIEKKGLDLGDGQAALMKKIEELTLYLIDMNKKIDEQNKHIGILEKAVAAGKKN